MFSLKYKIIVGSETENPKRNHMAHDSNLVPVSPTVQPSVTPIGGAFWYWKHRVGDATVAEAPLMVSNQTERRGSLFLLLSESVTYLES